MVDHYEIARIEEDEANRQWAEAETAAIRAEWAREQESEQQEQHAMAPSIIITNEQIETIAKALQRAMDRDWQPEEVPTVLELAESVESWLRRTIHDIEQEPEWYAFREDATVADFHDHRCISLGGWGICRNRPVRGSVYCQTCLDRAEEGRPLPF